MNSNATRARFCAFSTELRAVFPRPDGRARPERIAERMPRNVCQ